jgi:lysine 2,3-aminomutase
VQKGLEIIQQLRGWTSGLAVPHFVIDAPGGGGKVPLLPEYVEEINDDEVVFRNYEGKRFTYKQPRQVPCEEPLPAVAAQSDIVPIQRGKRAPKKEGAAAVRTRRRKVSGE